MLDHMKQILVQLDDALAEELERFVPGSSRKRSDFIRKAIARALLDVVEVTALHACDTATDDALVLAIAQGADHVLSLIHI